MASRAGGLAAQERFLQCCRRVDAAGSGTVPSKGLAVFLQRLGLEQQEVEGLLLEADAGGGCTDYVKLAGALWVSGPEGDDEASASSELRGEACAVVPDGGVREAGDEQPVPDATLDEAVPQHSFGLPIARKACAVVPDGGVREAGDEQPVPDATLDEAVPQHSFGLPIARKEAPRGAAEGAAGEPARQTLQDGSVYEGQLSPGGERHGWGRICFGSVYEGEWMHNQMHGNGKFISPDGSVYNGQWVENCIGPSGSISWPGGPEYVGAFRDGLQHGRGKVSWPDGRSYEGEFANGKQHGRGVYSKPPSFISLSEWHEGQFVQWLEGAVSEPSGSFSAGAEPP